MIKQQYIDTGKVYFVFRDLPLTEIHPGALLAAHAGNCAADQQSFWPMHERIFTGYDAGEWRQGTQADFQVFLGYARELGLDDATFRKCIESNQYAQQIVSDVRDAERHGIQSTPAFLINGRPLIGAQPFETFQRVFESMLAEGQ